MREKKNEKRMLNLKEQFLEAVRYIKESKESIYLVIGIFIFGIILSFFWAGKFSFLNEIIKNILLKTQGLSGFQLIFFILQNNLQSAFFGLFLGFFFGIFSILNAFLNGIVIGYVFFKVWSVSGAADFWRILPHGIFELPAIFISLGLGVKLGASLFVKNKKAEFKKRFYNSANAFLMIVLPLLIIAAIIEGALIVFFK